MDIDIAVIGSGPNGLAAAITCARAGLSVAIFEGQSTAGGGARTVDMGMHSEVVHDLCSAVHPLAAISPFLRDQTRDPALRDLLLPAIPLAHPLPASTPALMGSPRATAQLLRRNGDDRAARWWENTIAPAADRFEDIVSIVLGNPRAASSLLAHPAALLRLLQVLRTPRSGSHADLLVGCASHSMCDPKALSARGVGTVLALAAETVGWPIPRGGSGTIVDGLLREFTGLGGEVFTDAPCTALSEYGPNTSVILATSPAETARILTASGHQEAAKRPASRPLGAAASKVDFVVSEEIPWRDDILKQAGTVHLGGSADAFSAAEKSVLKGYQAENPVILLSQPGVVDSSRIATDGARPIWTYAHVPLEDSVDFAPHITARIEQYAPGFTDTVIASRSIPASEMSNHNASLEGGDISGGATDTASLARRFIDSVDPYRLRRQRTWWCSSATPPGPGVHCMSGVYAAKRVLKVDFGLSN